MPKISVIIPAYNQADFLGLAVQSVLNQTVQDFEIIIVDDGSTDRTRETATAFSDPCIRYVYQQNRGLSAARNTGIRNSRGEYLSYLDSDDQFFPDKLELLSAVLDGNPESGLVAGQAVPIDEHGSRIGVIYDTPLPSEPARLLLGNPLHVGSVMVRSTWQTKAGLFDENLRSYEDWDMWLRLLRLGCKADWVPKPVSLYRFHTGQMTRNSGQMTNATLAVLDKVFREPDLPEDWIALRNQAYSHAHLRATATYSTSGDMENASRHLLQAVQADPQLLENHASALASRLVSLAYSPKIRDPFIFVENIYNHLPQELDILRSRKKQNLGHLAVELAFDAYLKREYERVCSLIERAASYMPAITMNRGVISIYLRSSLKRWRDCLKL